MSTRADVATRFQPGNPGGGRPKGARNRLGDQFLERLRDDFDKHGLAAIQHVRENDTSTYFTTIAKLLPREVAASLHVQTTSGFTDEERITIRGVLDAIEAAGAQGIEPAQVFEMITHALRAELAKPIELLPPPRLE